MFTSFSDAPVEACWGQQYLKLVAQTKLMYFFKLQLSSSYMLKCEQAQMKTMGFWMLGILEFQTTKRLRVNGG